MAGVQDPPSAPTTAGPGFPACLDHVTSEWLDARLHDSGVIGATDAVTGFSSEPFGEGYGMMCDLTRLRLEYAAGSGPLATVIFKCSTSLPSNRAVGAAFDVYNREYRFYAELVDRVRHLAPACYFVDFEPATHDSSMLLEDLGDYRRGDQAAGCGDADVCIAVDTMSELHATWFDRTSAPEVAWVPRIDGDMYRTGMPAAVAGAWEPCVALFPDVVPPAIAGQRDRYLEKLPALHQRMGTGRQAVLHGDFRLDNLLFGDQDHHRALILIDWQGIIVSKPTQDLAYLLTQNLTVHDRRRCEKELVQRYSDALAGHGVAGYHADEVWADYQLATLLLWEYAVVIGGSLDPTNDRGVAFMRGLLERASAAISDHDLFSLLG